MIKLRNKNIELIDFSNPKTGSHIYSIKLFKALTNLNETEFSINRIYFDHISGVVKRSNQKGTISEIKRRKIPVLDNKLRPFWLFRNRRLIKGDYDLYHFLSPKLSFPDVSPRVVSCLDLIPILKPQHFLHYLSRVYYTTLKSAEAIIVISDYTKKDLLNRFQISEERIFRIYLGVDIQNIRLSTNYSTYLLNKYGIPLGKRYILNVGSEHPRKNIPTLIKAFQKVLNEEKDVHLLKVGNPDIKFSKRTSIELASKLGLKDHISFIDAVSEKELAGFYNLADIFVFPSFYEGFGLPPLEAMACGTPVISSNATSLPEVVGKAGILVDPYSIKDFANAMIKILEDDVLRKQISERGLERAKRFTWRNTALKTLEVYKKVLEDFD